MKSNSFFNKNIMKKNFIKSTMIAVVAIFAGYNVYQSNVNTIEMSDIMLANVEALAQNEGSDNWYCVGEFFTCLLDEQGRIYGEKHYIK